MKTSKYLVITFILITLTVFACAPSAENAQHAIDSHNYLFLGLYHGLISPLAVVGKILGLNIGIYDSGKDVFSYWLGYIIALYLYLRMIIILLPEKKPDKKDL